MFEGIRDAQKRGKVCALVCPDDAQSAEIVATLIKSGAVDVIVFARAKAIVACPFCGSTKGTAPNPDRGGYDACLNCNGV